MTVLDNLRMGAFVRSDAEIGARHRRGVRALSGARGAARPDGRHASGGEQQMLAIGRALVARPRLLLLDEPSLGLAPKFVTRIFLTLRELQQEGKTILLVEQNARQALQVADSGYVMERGRIVFSGSGAGAARHAGGAPHLSRAERRHRLPEHAATWRGAGRCGQCKTDMPCRTELADTGSRNLLGGERRCEFSGHVTSVRRWPSRWSRRRRPMRKPQAGRPLGQDRLPRAAHRQGRRVGPGRETLDGDRRRGDQRQGRHRRRADRADLLRHADARSRSAQGDEPAGRARQGAGDFRAVLQRRVRDHRAAARLALQDRDQLLLLGQARPLGDEQVGVPQHAHQRQAAQAGGRGLGRGIQAEEGRHHL